MTDRSEAEEAHLFVDALNRGVDPLLRRIERLESWLAFESLVIVALACAVAAMMTGQR